MSLLRRPTGWIPIALSFCIVAMLALYFMGVIPPDPSGDEGVAAHLFQIWLFLEAVFIVVFAVQFLPRNPKEASIILFLQLLGVFVGCFPVWYFHL